MEINIIKTGSRGNASVLTDAVGNQLLIDAGLKYEQIAKHITDFSKLTVLCTHDHGDHALSLKKFTDLGLKVISPQTEQSSSLIPLGAWTILPIAVPHSTALCYAYLIRNNIEGKNIFWATDLTELPRIKDGNFDLFAIECNYDEDIATEATLKGSVESRGYMNHLSANKLLWWLQSRRQKPKNLCLIHLSNSGLIDRDELPALFRDQCKRLYIGQKNTVFRI